MEVPYIVPYMVASDIAHDVAGSFTQRQRILELITHTINTADGLHMNHSSLDALVDEAKLMLRTFAMHMMHSINEHLIIRND